MCCRLRNVCSSAQVDDVTKLHDMRDALLTLDYQDPSSNDLKMMFQQALVHPRFRPTNEVGSLACSVTMLTKRRARKCSRFSLGWATRLCRCCIRRSRTSCPLATRPPLPTTARSHCRHAVPLSQQTQVYFRAWRGASGPILEKIEVADFSMQQVSI